MAYGKQQSMQQLQSPDGALHQADAIVHLCAL